MNKLTSIAFATSLLVACGDVVQSDEPTVGSEDVIEFQRISPERMRGIMWRMEAEVRRDTARARNAKAKVSQGYVKVVVVDLADWQAQHFGSRAG